MRRDWKIVSTVSERAGALTGPIGPRSQSLYPAAKTRLTTLYCRPSGLTAEGSAGDNLVGETVATSRLNGDFGIGARAISLYCGDWRQPSGRI
jgi:hypothetical protein